MLPKVPLWLISMLGNMIFEASSLYCWGADSVFNMCDDLYHVMFGGPDRLEVGEQKNGNRLQFRYHRWHACVRLRLSQ